MNIEEDKAMKVRNLHISDKDWNNLVRLSKHLSEQAGRRIPIARIIRTQITKILKETGFDEDN